MIIKEKEYLNSTAPRIKAGEEAEKDMAFYLRREFKDDATIMILNDLRLTHNQENAQIDHLILYPLGFIIIESKSIIGKVSVNEHLEWSRKDYNKGIPSPIEQVRLQQNLLIALLDDNADKMLSKAFGIQTRFGRIYFDMFIAISTSGDIIRPKKLIEELNIITKADQIPRKIIEKIKERKKDIINKVTGFTQGELKKITDFLILQDKKARNPDKFATQAVLSIDDFEKFVAQNEKEEKVAMIPQCPKCSADMVIRNGSDGKPSFYGCSTYSKTYCKGKRNAETLEII